MANLNLNRKSSSSNQYYATSSSSSKASSLANSNKMDVQGSRANIQASAYSVDAATGTLKAFHFTTRGAGGTLSIPHSEEGSGGGFEVSTGIPSPPPSPSDSVNVTTNSTTAKGARPYGSRNNSIDSKKGMGEGAAYAIAEESERLFCGTLGAVFLGEGTSAVQDRLAMGMRELEIDEDDNDESAEGGAAAVVLGLVKQQNKGGAVGGAGRLLGTTGLPTPSQSPEVDGLVGLSTPSERDVLGAVSQWVEIWDYAGGLRFRAFVAEKDEQRALFVFFGQEVIGRDLKPGLMTLLELAGSEGFECQQLVTCVDRQCDQEDVQDLVRNLGWVGFELMTLSDWSDGQYCTSDNWIFLGMDV